MLILKHKWTGITYYVLFFLNTELEGMHLCMKWFESVKKERGYNVSILTTMILQEHFSDDNIWFQSAFTYMISLNSHPKIVEEKFYNRKIWIWALPFTSY